MIFFATSRASNRSPGPRASRIVTTFVSALLAVLAVTSVQSGTPVSASPLKTTHRIQLGIGTNYQYPVNAVNEPSDLGTLRSEGISSLREGIFWHIVQPDSPHDWNWSSYDSMFARAALQHARILPVLAFGTSWASPSGNIYAVPHSRAGRAAYATFVKAVVSRYGPSGTFWATWSGGTAYPIRAVELWNEPWFLGETTPYNYALLVSAAARAVHVVNPTVAALANVDDRNVKSRSGQWIPWGALVLRHKWLLHQVNGWAIHPYPTTAIYLNQTSLQNSIMQVDWLRSQLQTDSMPGRIWVTEIGFSNEASSFEPTANAASASSTYAQFLQRVAHMTGPQAPRSVYVFTAARPNASTKPSSWDYGYNLFSSNGTPTRALLSAASTAQALH